MISMANYTLFFVICAILGGLIAGYVTGFIPSLLGEGKRELLAQEFEEPKKIKARAYKADKLLEVKAVYFSGDMMFMKVAEDGQELTEFLPVKLDYNKHTKQLDIPALALHPTSTLEEFVSSKSGLTWEWEGKMTRDGVMPEGMKSVTDAAGGTIVGWQSIADLQAARGIATSTTLDTRAAIEDGQEKQAKNVKEMIGGSVRMSRGDKGQ